MLHVALVLACLLIFAGVFFSIRAAVRKKVTQKRNREDALSAYGSLFDKDPEALLTGLPNGYVIFSGDKVFTEWNHRLRELTFVGTNTLTDSSYPYFMLGQQIMPNKEPTDVLYPITVGSYQVYSISYSGAESLYLWVSPGRAGDLLAESGGAKLYTSAGTLSMREKAEYDYNIQIGNERDGTLENAGALCRITDASGNPPNAVSAEFTEDGITLTVKNENDRITEIRFNDNASYPLSEPVQSVTVPISFLLSVPTTPVYPNDLLVTVESSNSFIK